MSPTPRRSSGTAQTGTRTRVRSHPLLPDRHSWIDVGFTLVLAGVVLSAFGTSFTGSDYLLVGLLGALISVVVTHLTRAAGWPIVSAVVICVAVFFLLGGPLCLRSLGDTSVLPGASTLARVADQAIFGWKDLLTTLPPIDGDGPLLVLPWLAGMLTGLVGLGLAHLPVRRAWLAAALPVLGLTAVLSGAILLGVRHPQSLLLQGSVFAGLALAWLAIRARRASAAVQGGSTSYVRGAGAVVMLALAAGVAFPASALIGDGDDARAVARNWVEPPFDIGRYPSPLAGFRKYVDLKGRNDPSNVYDKVLLDVQGVAPQTRIRFATMDRYDGMVWGATDNALPGAADDSFQRVSSTIDNPVDGREVDVTVTLGEGWNGVWLPTVGALQSMRFETADARAKAEVFRYNLATSTAVVPTGLQQGDRYSFTAVEPDDTLTPETVASAEATTPLPPGAAFIQGPTEKWTEEAGSDPMARVFAAAEHLKSEGKYSDGVGRNQRIYVGGHSVWRLSDEFVNAPQIVGNDEQYAATMALIANDIGVPARVVLGAVVPEGGTVTGKDVSAWVELRAADGSWRTLPTEAFTPTTPPADQVPETNTPMSGTVIPPPNPIPPPSDAGEQSDADLKERKATRKKADAEEGLIPGLPTWVGAVLTYVGGPLLLAALLLGAVIALKALRRHRRRSADSASARFVGAWRELVDHARDLGQVVPLGATVTRREQSLGIVSGQAGALARRADSFVFGPSAPEAAAATTYWEQVDAERRAMSQQVGRRQRLVAAVSLRSFLRGGPARRGDPGADGPEATDATSAETGRRAGLSERLRSLADWRSRRTPD